MTEWYRIWIGSLNIEPFMVDMSGPWLCDGNGDEFELNDNLTMIRPTKVQCVNAVIDYLNKLRAEALGQAELQRIEIQTAIELRQKIQDGES